MARTIRFHLDECCDPAIAQQESTTMTIARSARRRIQFEALERRLALSGGGAALHGPGAEVLARKIPKTIPITLSVHISFVTATSVTYTDVSGKLGKIQFTSGHGGGSEAGSLFEGGSVVVSNTSGSITLDLGPGALRRAGKHSKVKISVTAESGTGAYDDVGGSAGSVTVLIPEKIGAASSAKGDFNHFDTTAAGELGY
jgi:hypothetical protein